MQWPRITFALLLWCACSFSGGRASSVNKGSSENLVRRANTKAPPLDYPNSNNNKDVAPSASSVLFVITSRRFFLTTQQPTVYPSSAPSIEPSASAPNNVGFAIYFRDLYCFFVNITYITFEQFLNLILLIFDGDDRTI